MATCSPLDRTRRQEEDNYGLLPPNHDVCDDPSTGRPFEYHGITEENRHAYIEHVKLTSIEIKDLLIHGQTQIENRLNCPSIVEGMQELDLSDFITVHATGLTGYQSNVTQMYIEIRQLLYLFEIMNSPKLEECCLHTRRYYLRLKNQLINKWFNLKSNYGQAIDDSHCCISGFVDVNQPLTCDMIRDISYTVIRKGVSTLERSIDFLQNWINALNSM